MVRAIKWTLLAVVLVFVGRSLWQNLRQVDFSAVRIAPLALAGSLITITAIYIMQMLSYRFLLASYARKLPWRVMMAVAWVPILGKYVPGKVAAIAGAVLLLRRFGVGAAVALSVVLVLDGLAVLAGLMLGSRLLLLPEMREKVPGGWVLMVAVIVGGLICVAPPIYGRLVNLALRILRRRPLPRSPTLREYALPAMTAVMQWIFSGTGLWLMCHALGASPQAGDWPMFVSVAALAMTISYLALFAPGGIGVREGIFMLGLGPIIGLPAASVVVVAMRIAHTLIELLLSAIGWACLRNVPPATDAPA